MIYQAVKDLKHISNLSPFLQKIQLLQKLICIRVRFARFLILYRWRKFNPHVNKNNSKPNSFSYEKKIQIIKCQVKEYQTKTQRNQRNAFKSKQRFTEQYNLIQFLQTNLNKSNNRKKTFPILSSFLDNYKEFTHIKTIYVIKKNIYINADPYYQLVLKNKDQICTILHLKLKCDKNIQFPSELLIQLVSHLDHLDLTKPKELFRIDSYLFSFYIICFFCKIVKKLIEISESFNCQISRESNNLVLIIFPKSFQPFNQFILRINPTSNNIEIFSKKPLFHPPKDPRTINEEFEKLDVDIFIPMKIYSRIIDITKEFNGSLLLSELRDLVFYTNVRRFWIFLKSEMRSTVWPILKINLTCKYNSIYYISIRFNERPCRLLTIIFQSSDGLPIFIPISNHYNLDIQHMFPDVKKLFSSLFILYTNNLDFSHMFKSHFLSLMRKFELIDSLNYRIDFSFSDHFYIVKRNLLLFPTLTLQIADIFLLIDSKI